MEEVAEKDVKNGDREKGITRENQKEVKDENLEVRIHGKQKMLVFLNVKCIEQVMEHEKKKKEERNGREN